jgi:hypothetical protein
MRRGSANGKTFTAGVSHTDDVGELFHCGRRFLERRILIRDEIDLDDMLHAPRTKLDRHAEQLIADGRTRLAGTANTAQSSSRPSKGDARRVSHKLLYAPGGRQRTSGSE